MGRLFNRALRWSVAVHTVSMPPAHDVHFVNNCLTCIPVALFLYDWVLTVGDEVELIWSRKLSWKSDQPIFLLLRYGTLALVAMMGVLFTSVSEAEHRRQTMASIVGTLFIFALAQVLLQMRVYVIYGRSRVVLWTNLALFAIEAAIIIYLFLHLFSRANLTCHIASCSAYPRSFGLVYVAPLVFESYLLALAAYKALANRRLYHFQGHTSILGVLIRGSVVYFALVASGMAISMILFTAAPNYVDWLNTLSDATASIGGTRLILSAREALLRPAPQTHPSTVTDMYIAYPRSGSGGVVPRTEKPVEDSEASYISF